jgi:hypothetical protein
MFYPCTKCVSIDSMDQFRTRVQEAARALSRELAGLGGDKWRRASDESFTAVSDQVNALLKFE